MLAYPGRPCWSKNALCTSPGRCSRILLMRYTSHPTKGTICSCSQKGPLVETHDSNDQVGPVLRRVLDTLTPLPAYVIGRQWDFLAWNTSAEQVLFLSQSVPPYEQNAIWRMFANPLASAALPPEVREFALSNVHASRMGIAPGKLGIRFSALTFLMRILARGPTL